MKKEDKKILSEAINNFEIVTGMRILPFITEDKIELELKENEYPIVFEAMIVPIISKSGISVLQNKLNQLEGTPILIVRYINQELAILLKELGINYLDTAGNMYVRVSPLFIYIKGSKLHNNSIIKVPKRNKVRYKTASLQLIFALLCNPGLEKNPYREIAEIAKIGLGTVQLYMNKLKSDGFLIRNNRNEFILINKEKLLDLWVEDYPYEIKAKNIIGRYEITKQQIKIEDTIVEFEALLGGETAAAKVTSYLRPFIHTIYIGDKVGEFILRNRLVKRPNGNIELIKKFWNFEDDNSQRNLVPNILIYADLLSTNDQRNIETAKIIYEKEIIQYLR